MARSRMIKPEFFTDPKVGKLSRDARVFLMGLLVQADDVGNVMAEPVFLRSRIFPWDEDLDSASIQGFLDECSAVGLIALYEHSSNTYAHIVNFLKHQKIDKPSQWRNPPPPKPVEQDDSTATPRGLDAQSAPKSQPKPKPKPNSAGGAATRPINKNFELFEAKVKQMFPSLELTLDQFESWHETYPDANLIAALVNVQAWLDDRPERPPNRRPRGFLVNWFGNAQTAADKSKPVKPDEPILENFLDYVEQMKEQGQGPLYTEAQAQSDFEDAHKRWRERG